MEGGDIKQESRYIKELVVLPCVYVNMFLSICHASHPVAHSTSSTHVSQSDKYKHEITHGRTVVYIDIILYITVIEIVAAI